VFFVALTMQRPQLPGGENRGMHRSVAALLIALLLAGDWFARALAQVPSAAPQTPEPMRYESPDEAAVNTWWLPTPDGGVVVFDALRTISDANAAAQALMTTARPVHAILLTHPHPDHITGLATLKESFPRARIYSTAEGVSYLSGKGKTLLRMNVEARGRTDATEQIPAPDVLLQDGQRLAVGGLNIEVTLLGSGESPAATVYFLPSMRMLVVGDILTPRRVPLLAAGRTAAWLKQIETLRNRFDPSTRILPGHGPMTNLRSAADWQERYIKSFRAQIQQATRAATAGGTCVTRAEGQRILRFMRREYPTDGRVARMPSEALDALNLEGVNWELTGRTCPGTENPIR
jgi:glyoxylase-like metal-dependent hydrolase (beta-lactamase superfamily II)